MDYNLQNKVFSLEQEMKEAFRMIDSLGSQIRASERREQNLYKALSSQQPVLIVNYSMSYDGAQNENVLIYDNEIIREFEKSKDLVYLERAISPIIQKEPEDVIVFGMVMVNTHPLK